jgi:hypothetical protein
MRNVSDKFVEKIKKKHFKFNIFVFENYASYDITWTTAVAPDRPQIAEY